MARHHVWEPTEDDPPLLSWYDALVGLSRRARAERIHWPMLVEDFELVRRVDRHGATRIWTYRHRANGGELHVDDGGATYSYRPHPSAEAGGRFVSTTLRRAVYDAQMHRQPEDLWYEFPGDRRAEAVMAAPPEPAVGGHDRPGVHGPRRRRRHLVLIPGSAD